MRYGAFEIVSELHRGPRASVHVGRREGSSDDRFAVKVVEPNVSIIGQRAAEQRCEAFLESMRVQQLAASGNSRHWVKVHEMGRVEDAAFAAMDRYRSSVEELVTFRRDAEAGQLHEIISGVVAGLVELDGKYKALATKLDEDEVGAAPSAERDDEEGDTPRPAGRCHGNLKPANVLLGENNSDVALADPANDAQVAENHLTVKDDLRAVGNLIYSLVLHREWRGGFGAKVESGSQWNKLGRTGEGWFRLCSGLVEGDGGAHEAEAPRSLDELAAAVAALSPALKTNSRRPMVMVGGAVAVVFIVGIFALSMFRGGEPDAPAVVVTTDPEQEVAYEPEPPVDDPDEPVDAPTEFASPLQRAWFISLEQDRTAVTSLSPLRTLAERREVTDEQIVESVSAVVNEANALWPSFEQNGWGGVRGAFPKTAAEIEMLLRDEQLNDEILLDQVKRAAAVVSFLDREVQSEWNVFNEALERIAVADDDIALSQFGSTGRDRVASVTTLRALRQTIRDHNRLARDLGAAVETHWSRIDHDFFRAQSGLYPPPAVPDLAFYERWMNAATSGDYGRIDQQPASPDFAMVFGELDRVLSLIGDACGTEADRQVVEKLRSLQREHDDLPWDGTREAAREFERTIDEFQRQVAAARTQLNTQLEVCRNCMAELERQVATEPDVTGALRAYWDQAKVAIAGAEAECNERVQRVQAIRDGLVNLDRELEIPLAGRWSDPQMRAAAALRRDAIAGETLSGLDALETRLDSHQWGESRAEFDRWIEAADAWLDDHDALAAQLPQFPRFAAVQADYDRWQAMSGEFDALEPLVEPMRRRIEALRSVETQTLAADGRREMLDMLSNAEHPELRVAAWWRLGETMSDIDALQTEQFAWETIAGVLGEVDEDRRDELQSQMQQERGRRWRQHAAAVDSPQAIVAAIELRREFGIDDDASLDNWLEFNVHLHEFLRAAQDAGEEDLCDRSSTLLSHVDRFWPNEADRPHQIETMRQRLVAMERACSGEGTDFAGIGPGAMGWFGTVEEDGRLLRFDPPENVEAVADHPPLYFRRVDMPDGRLVFLCTTEVSLGLFKYVIEEHAARPSDWLPGSFRGARGWELLQGRIVLRDRWLEDLSEGAGFACVGRLSTPSPEVPAHQVTLGSAIFVASKFGARLPLLDEWRAAFDQTYLGGSISAAAANLRGREWIAPLQEQIQIMPSRQEWWVSAADEPDALQRQRLMTQTGFSPDNPFDSIFYRETLGQNRFKFSDEDGWHWFRPVHGDSVAGDRAFRDLAGNVAEFVLSDAGPLGPLSGNEFTNQQLKQVFTDNEGIEAFVVGASALSDPAIAVSEPQRHDIRRGRQWNFGYPDVGFRLAIEMQPGQEPTASPRAIVDRLQANPPYILASEG